MRLNRCQFGTCTSYDVSGHFLKKYLEVCKNGSTKLKLTEAKVYSVDETGEDKL